MSAFFRCALFKFSPSGPVQDDAAVLRDTSGYSATYPSCHCILQDRASIVPEFNASTDVTLALGPRVLWSLTGRMSLSVALILQLLHNVPWRNSNAWCESSTRARVLRIPRGWERAHCFVRLWPYLKKCEHSPDHRKHDLLECCVITDSLGVEHVSGRILVKRKRKRPTVH